MPYIDLYVELVQDLDLYWSSASQVSTCTRKVHLLQRYGSLGTQVWDKCSFCPINLLLSGLCNAVLEHHPDRAETVFQADTVLESNSVFYTIWSICCQFECYKLAKLQVFDLSRLHSVCFTETHLGTPETKDDTIWLLMGNIVDNETCRNETKPNIKNDKMTIGNEIHSSNLISSTVFSTQFFWGKTRPVL